MASTGASYTDKPLIIERGKAFAIKVSKPGQEYRAQICAINGLTYIQLSKFWYQETIKKWLPTKRGVCIPHSTWEDLLTRGHAITQALKQFEKVQEEGGSLSDIANSGTSQYSSLTTCTPH